MNKNLTFKDIKNNVDDRTEQPWNFYIIGFLSPYVAYFFGRFMPFTPNQISFFWGVLGIVAGIIMSLGGYGYMLLGIFVYYIAILFDYIDGEIAKTINFTTLGGAYLDRFNHYIHRGILVLGMGIGIYNTNHNHLYLYLGIFCALAFTYDNLAKLKVYEVLANEDDYERMKKMKERFKEQGHTDSFTKNFKQKMKSYTLEMLRPNNPFTLIFFVILIGFILNYFVTWAIIIAEGYIILMTLVCLYLLIKTLKNIYKDIGNVRTYRGKNDRKLSEIEEEKSKKQEDEKHKVLI